MPFISLSLNLTKSLFALILYLLLATQGWGQNPTNGGFENGVTNWTTTGSAGSTNARTGTNSLAHTTTSTSNVAHTNSSTISVSNNNYAHVIGWAIGSNVNSRASCGGTLGTNAQSANVLTIGTTLTRLTYVVQNTTGSTQNFSCRVNTRSLSGSTTVYWDDVIMYTSSTSTTDLTAPTAATSFTNGSITSSSIAFNWSNGSDAATGIQNTIILRTTNTSAATPYLNDQGVYSVAGGTSGPNTVGDWTVISVSVGSGTTSYTDNTIASGTSYKYAVIHRDLAYNYSTALVSGTITSSSSSSSSNIITNSSFTYPTNIDYTAYQGTSLTTANSIEVGQFTIQDGGGSADADALTTQLTALTLSVANSAGLRRIALFDGSTNLAEVAGASSAVFSGLSLSAADDGSKTFSVRVSFLNTSAVIDNQQFSFTVNSATANSSGSTFAAANAGGAITSTTGDINRIEVSTTDIIFDQNVSNVAENAVMSPSPTVRAIDNNVNYDLDNTSSVVMTITSGSTTFGSATTTVSMIAGTATFSNLVFATPANTNALTVTQGAMTDISNSFNVTAASPEINVKQGATNLASGSGSHVASSVVSGNSGSAITFTIENLGSANLTYSSITSSNTTDFTLNTASTSSPLTPNGNTTFTVTFNPTTAGSKTTTITINNNDVDEGTYTFTVTGTGTVSTASDIITNSGFSYSSNIAYASIQTATSLTTGNSVAVQGYTLRDGGAISDADNLGTTLTAISFTTGGSTAIRTAAIFDGSTNIAEVAVNGATTFSFSGLSISATDASTKNFELRVTYQVSVTDNQQITFTVNSATASSTSSGFAAANAGGAASSTSNDINRLEVTADRLAWVQQPSTVIAGQNMSPSPTISANDANNNRDLDYTSTITLTPSASSISAGSSNAAVSGLATFSGLQFPSVVSGITLAGADGILISTGNSSSFNVSVQAPGLLLLEDNFTHTGILTSNGYFANSGTGSNNLTAGTTGLTYANYGSSNIGNALAVANTGEDVYRTFSAQNSPTTVYSSFLVKVSAAQTGDYFFAFAPSSNSSNYRARTFIKASSNSGYFNFGISNAGTANYNSTPTDYALNTTHLVVVKYTFTSATSATATVYVNPDTSTEPSFGEVSFTDNTAANVPADIISFAIRQGSSSAAPTLVIDGIRIATNWGVLMGNPQYNGSSDIASGNYNSINVISGTITTTGGTSTIPGNVTVHGTTTNNGTISTTAYNTLTINGTISGSGQIDASSGTVAFGNTTDLSFPSGVFTGTIANLSKTAGAGTLTLNDALTTVGNLTTNASTGAVIIAASKQLTVTGTLTNNGTLTVENGATFKQGSSVAGSGTYNVKQTLTDNAGSGSTLSGRYWYMGTPVSCTRAVGFGSAGNLNKVWSFTNGAYSAVADATTLSPTTGYVHRRSDNTTLNFTGTNLYATDVTLSLSNNAGTYGGWHLIANPYTAYLDWQQVYNASYALSTAISPSYYIRSFNSTGNDVNALITYNSSTGLESNTSSYSLGSTGSTTAQYIAPMQAFWVKINPTTPLSATAGQLRLERAFTSHQTGNVGLKNSTVFPTLARVNLVDGARFDQLLVFMNQDMSNAVDQYDSEKMFVSGAPQIYTMAAGKKLVMNGLKNNKKKISVPLYLELPESKVYNLQLAEYILEDGLILLEDKQEGIIQDFTIHDVYPFYANSGVLSNRFVLHFFAPDNGITAQGPSNSWVEDETSYTEGGQIVISADGKGKVQITLDQPDADNNQATIQAVDANGRVVYSGLLEGITTEIQLDVPSGVYYLTVQSGNLIEKKKVFIQE